MKRAGKQSKRRAALASLLVALFLSATIPCAADDDAPPTDGEEASTASKSSAMGSRFWLEDVFDLEWAADPQVSPDGTVVAYVRTSMDVWTDQRRTAIWTVRSDGTGHRPLVTGKQNVSSPRWSPGSDRIAYVEAQPNGAAQIHVRWLDTGQSAQITSVARSPADIVWSPDGRWIAFTMLVPEAKIPFVEMPAKPKGAEWAEPPRVIESVRYRFDGQGYVENGFRQVFIVPHDGGTPRALTSGPYHHGASPSFTPDGKHLVFAANRDPDWEYDPVESEIYELEIESGEIRQLTTRDGPDRMPAVSPDGRFVAYTGFDDRKQGYHLSRLYVLDRETGESKELLTGFDRDVKSPHWDPIGRGLYFLYDDLGNTKLANASFEGEVRDLSSDVGGLAIGRPYASGSFSVSRAGEVAFPTTRPESPADVGFYDPNASADAPAGEAPRDPADSSPSRRGVRRLTQLNRDLLGHKSLARVEELWWRSSHDGRRIQGWVAKPPEFDPARKYPLILEIHGGPFANYGDRFAAEVQLYCAAGYVVLYANPRGSTSYGEEFGNLIHHDYPSEDYDDLMSGVDEVIARGFVDPERLYVTGGSGGGVLTAWIVGKTDRFRAAVSAKPVINWYSFVLTADAYTFFARWWFPGPPWEHPEEYLRRSPLSLVGNVKTPTMLLTGERDYRTPMSESEQFYQALKLRRIPAALVRIPGASHGIAHRPSQLIGKVAHVLKWFERYGGAPSAGE